MIRKRTMAGVMALLIGITAIEMGTPVAAGGRVSFTVTPRGQNADVIRDGLHWCSLFRRARNQARVDQRGSGNGAAVSQSGNDNVARVFQRGRGHSAAISQNGNNNAFGIFQFGRNTSTAARQNGNGNVDLVFEGGW